MPPSNPRGGGEGASRGGRTAPRAAKGRKRKTAKNEDDDEDDLEIKEEDEYSSPAKKSKVVSALQEGR